MPLCGSFPSIFMNHPHVPIPAIEPTLQGRVDACGRPAARALASLMMIATLGATSLFSQPATAADTASERATSPLREELRELREELARLRAEVEQLRQLRGQSAAAPLAGEGAGAAATQAAQTAIPSATAPGASATSSPSRSVATASETPGTSSLAREASSAPIAPSAVSIFGYGELSYTRPRQDPSQAVATARRGVIGLGYSFDERTRMALELEVEQAVVSATDKGEVAFEQLYIEHDLTNSVSAKAGLFLMPVGYLNEVHEPTRYMGVTRNFVETAIIPTTWREMGLGLRGTTEAGLRWDAALVTGFDLGKWNANSTDPVTSPLGAIHQEGSLARAANLAGVIALNWNGTPGFNLGGSLYAGGVGQHQSGFAAPNASVGLGEIHARLERGPWTFTGLAAAGRFQGVDALNASFAGQSAPVPARFAGSYLQAAWRAWGRESYQLVPFTRLEWFNTALGGYPGLSGASAAWAPPASRVWTTGASFYLNPQVVLKADYQRFADQSALDRVNLGVGFHF
jgi:hypothetical protein